MKCWLFVTFTFFTFSHTKWCMPCDKKSYPLSHLCFLFCLTLSWFIVQYTLPHYIISYALTSYTKILEVDLFAFAYRLFHEDFSPINGACLTSSLIHLLLCPLDVPRCTLLDQEWLRQKHYSIEVRPNRVRTHDLQIMTVYFMPLRRLV